LFIFLQFALTLVAVLGGIIYLLWRNSLPALGEIGIRRFFTDQIWDPTGFWNASYGLVPMITSTAMITAASQVLAVPLSLGAALYLAEVATDRQRAILKPAIELLAGVPSVVVGFLGITVLSPLLTGYLGFASGLNALNGAILLAVMSLPTIITLAEDALSAVPATYSEASLALGASPWQTMLKVKVPAARSGIAAAIILGVGRAVGETMTVLMAAGNALARPESLADPARTMTATIAIELGEVAYNSTHYSALFVVGFVLLCFTLILNLVSRRLTSGQNMGKKL